jgi:hypothetical protein
MKKRSERYPYVFFGQWKTPIQKIDYIYLHLTGILQTKIHTHFLFEAYGDGIVRTMTVPADSSYRVVDEGLGLTCIGKYFATKGPYKPYKRGKGRPAKLCSTWKLRNASFVRELDEGHNLFRDKKEKSKANFEYFIKTSNDWITFVSSRRPVWRVHHHIRKTERVVLKYLKEEMQKQHK